VELAGCRRRSVRVSKEGQKRTSGAKARFILLGYTGDESPAYRTNEFGGFRPDEFSKEAQLVSLGYTDRICGVGCTGG
jgi:hypothetical protein